MTNVENFRQTMLEIKEFYKDSKNLGAKFQLPNEIALQEGDLPEAAKEEGTRFKQDAADYLTDVQKDCSSNAEKAEKDKDIEAFKEKMAKLKEDTLKNANDKINTMYDRMIEIGIQYPESQSAISIYADELASFFKNDIYGKAESTITSTIDEIGNILDKVVSTVEEAFSDLWHDITDWF
jgi:hypothetical protein